MDELRIEQRPVISGGGLRHPLVLSDVLVVDGVTVFKLLKTDDNIRRLLVGPDVKDRRPLCRTSVFELIVQARDRECRRLVENPEGKEELGVEGPSRWPGRAIRDQLPRIVTIPCPTIGDAAACAIKMLKPTFAKAPPWVELQVATIEYLRLAIESELASGATHRVHRRVAEGEGAISIGEQGISFSYARRAVLAKRPVEDGSIKKKFFKVAKSGGVDQAIEDASAWRKEAAPVPLLDAEASASSDLCS